jgi:hypothetical protein
MYPFFPGSPPFSFPPVFNTLPATSTLSTHVTCPKQRLSFQHTPDYLHNFVSSLLPSFCYMQLYHNANASDVDSFSTHSDGTKVQPQRKEEGNIQGKNADIGDKSMPVIGSGRVK